LAEVISFSRKVTSFVYHSLLAQQLWGMRKLCLRRSSSSRWRDRRCRSRCSLTDLVIKVQQKNVTPCGYYIWEIHRKICAPRLLMYTAQLPHSSSRQGLLSHIPDNHGVMLDMCAIGLKTSSVGQCWNKENV